MPGALFPNQTAFLDFSKDKGERRSVRDKSESVPAGGYVDPAFSRAGQNGARPRRDIGASPLFPAFPTISRQKRLLVVLKSGAASLFSAAVPVPATRRGEIRAKKDLSLFSRKFRKMPRRRLHLALKTFSTLCRSVADDAKNFKARLKDLGFIALLILSLAACLGGVIWGIWILTDWAPGAVASGSDTIHRLGLVGAYNYYTAALRKSVNTSEPIDRLFWEILIIVILVEWRVASMLAHLEKSVHERLKGLDSQLKGLDSTLGDLNDKVENLEGSVKDLSRSVDSLDM